MFQFANFLFFAKIRNPPEHGNRTCKTKIGSNPLVRLAGGMELCRIGTPGWGSSFFKIFYIENLLVRLTGDMTKIMGGTV